jgi:hypothetical protein
MQVPTASLTPGVLQVQGAGRGRPTEHLGTGGARGRGARRGPARVRAPST